MKKFIFFLCAVFLLFGMTGVAGAAAVYVPNVDAGSGWHDADKTGGDGLLCWAAATSNALAYTEWYGWDGADFIGSADDIFAEYRSVWPNATGSAMYGSEWWFWDSNASAYDNTPFPISGKDFYPGVNWNDNWLSPPGSDHDVYGWCPETYYDSNTSTWVNNYETHMDSIEWYITDPEVARAIVISIDGEYGHSLSVWGMDPDVGELYVTDSDDGIPALLTLNYSQHGDFYWYLDGYAGSDWKINEVHRIDFNLDGIEPNYGNGPGVEPVPEPATLFLVGSGLMGLFGLGRKKFFRR